MVQNAVDLEQLSINTIRTLAMDAVQTANWGHPGMPTEAASLAGTLGLGNLIYLYDDNNISIEGNTDIAFTEQVGKRFEAYGWQVQKVDGNDTAGIEKAIDAARADIERPSLIIVSTQI